MENHFFIDELHTIIGSGSGIDSTLDRGEYFETRSSTWNSSYGLEQLLKLSTRSILRKIAALSRRFAKITIEEPKCT